jgi:hypothetical protein
MLLVPTNFNTGLVWSLPNPLKARYMVAACPNPIPSELPGCFPTVRQWLDACTCPYLFASLALVRCRKYPGELMAIWDSRACQLVLPAFDASLPAWHLHHLAAQLALGDGDLLAAVSTSPAHEPPWFSAGEQQPGRGRRGGAGPLGGFVPAVCCLGKGWAGGVGTGC